MVIYTFDRSAHVTLIGINLHRNSLQRMDGAPWHSASSSHLMRKSLIRFESGKQHFKITQINRSHVVRNYPVISGFTLVPASSIEVISFPCPSPATLIWKLKREIPPRTLS